METRGEVKVKNGFPKLARVFHSMFYNSRQKHRENVFYFCSENLYPTSAIYIHIADDGFNGEMYQYFDPAADIPAIVLAVLILIVNGLVLLLMAKKKNLRSITNLLLCSLATSDLLTGLVAVPMFITCNIIRQSEVCLTEEELSRFISASIVCHLMAVTTDR